MQRPIVSMLLASVLVAAACAPAPPPPPPAGPTPAEMVSAADALDKRFLEAFNKNDAAAAMALYWNSPDLASYPPDHMGIRGWTAVNAAMIETMKGMAGVKFEILDARNEAHGGVVLGSGRWKLTLPAAKGPATVIEGRYTDVKAQKDGKWVYLVDHASVPLPPPPDAGKKKE